MHIPLYKHYHCLTLWSIIRSPMPPISKHQKLAGHQDEDDGNCRDDEIWGGKGLWGGRVGRWWWGRWRKRRRQIKREREQKLHIKDTPTQLEPHLGILIGIDKNGEIRPSTVALSELNSKINMNERFQNNEYKLSGVHKIEINHAT